MRGRERRRERKRNETEVYHQMGWTGWISGRGGVGFGRFGLGVLGKERSQIPPIQMGLMLFCF